MPRQKQQADLKTDVLSLEESKRTIARERDVDASRHAQTNNQNSALIEHLRQALKVRATTRTSLCPTLTFKRS